MGEKEGEARSLALKSCPTAPGSTLPLHPKQPGQQGPPAY